MRREDREPMKAMKKKETNQRAGRASPSQRVHIEFHDQQAHEVCIAGTFNEWQPTATPLRSLGAGDWAAELSLPPGRFEYRLVVDGQWRCDPAASESVPNGFGSCNSVLVVASRQPGRRAP